jgi:hypothetical protein
MKRVVVGLVVLLAACEQGLYEPIDPESGSGPPPSGTPGDAEVRSLFTQHAEPAMARSTCTACHTVAPNPIFGTTYDALARYLDGRVLNCNTPMLSLLVTIGQHTGPPFQPNDKTIVEDWLIDWAAMSSMCGN